MRKRCCGGTASGRFTPDGLQSAGLNANDYYYHVWAALCPANETGSAVSVDPNSTLSLFVAHRGALVSYAANIVGDRSQAEDVVQEAYLRFDAAARTDSLREPLAYLYRIVRNLALDGHRKHASEARFIVPAGTSLAGEPADTTPTPETVSADRDELRRVMAALDELPERTRIALEMHRFGGFKLREIADRLGISVTAAHALVAEALVFCRQRVRPDIETAKRQ